MTTSTGRGWRRLALGISHLASRVSHVASPTRRRVQDRRVCRHLLALVDAELSSVARPLEIPSTGRQPAPRCSRAPNGYSDHAHARLVRLVPRQRAISRTRSTKSRLAPAPPLDEEALRGAGRVRESTGRLLPPLNTKKGSERRRGGSGAQSGAPARPSGATRRDHKGETPGTLCVPRAML